MIKNYLCLVVSIILSPLHLLYIIIEKLVEIDFAAWMTMLWVSAYHLYIQEEIILDFSSGYFGLSG